MKNEKQEKENEMSMLELEQLVGKYGYAKEQEIESNRMCVMRRWQNKRRWKWREGQ